MAIQFLLGAMFNSLGLLGASKVMNISLGLIRAFVVVVVASTMSHFVLKGLGLNDAISIISLLAMYVLLLKIATGEGIISVIKLAVLAVIVEYVIVAAIFKIVFPITVAV